MEPVLDASVTVAWAMQDESEPLAESVLRTVQAVAAAVPVIWWYEVRNILVMNERRGRIETSASERFLVELLDMPIRVDPFNSDREMPELARRSGLTVYDAAYLDLALREGLPLATLDKALRRAARSAGVALLT